MVKTQSKRLLIIRHAHRDKPFGSSFDNGLSLKGIKQAEELRDRFEEKLTDRNPDFISSPKKRCIETVQPLCDALGKKLEVSALLDEGENLEARVRQFCDVWKKRGPLHTVVCSHGDWIPVCVDFLTGRQLDIEKAGWIEVELDGDDVAEVRKKS